MVLDGQKVWTEIPYTKGSNSSLKGSIFRNLEEYAESMVLIIYSKNESNLTNRN